MNTLLVFSLLLILKGISSEDWRQVHYYPPLSLNGHSTVVTNNGKSLFYGGSNLDGLSLSKLYLFDSVAETMTFISEGEGRSSHIACYFEEKNSMVVYGGYSANNTFFIKQDNFLEYHIDTNTWKRYNTSYFRERNDMTLACNPKDNQLILFGGREKITFSDLWTLDLNKLNQNWTLVNNHDIDPTFMGVGTYSASSNRFYDFGNITLGRSAEKRLNLSPGLISFDFDTKKWENLTDESTPNLLGPSFLEYDDMLLVFGGCTNFSSFGCASLTSSLFILDLQESSPKWKEFKTPLDPRWMNVAFIVNGELFIHGGETLSFEILSDMWAFKIPVRQKLSSSEEVPKKRFNKEAVVAVVAILVSVAFFLVIITFKLRKSVKTRSQYIKLNTPNEDI